MEQRGEKTEQPTQRRLEEAIKKGQFPRSAEVQTLFVLVAALLAMRFAGREMWGGLVGAFWGVLGHLHDVPLTVEALPAYGMTSMRYVLQCVAPLVIGVMAAGLLAGAIQSRFQTASEALNANWERLHPVEGLKRLFSFRSAVPAGIAILKLAVVIALTYSEVREVLLDPIFYTTVSPEQIGRFLASACFRIMLRVCAALAVIAALDYTYQYWRTQKDLMMTKEEVKEEAKHTEGNPQVKARQRQRRMMLSQRRMLLEVPKADVVVTNPVHLAVALRYDRRTMRAPKIVAKGSRLNAERIKAIARRHQVPIVENKPLARLMFRYGKVGGEIPAELYAAVAEILAWVYRVNRYRYYSEQNQSN